MRKTLYDISWQVSEPQYRADPALSYSTLAKFEREGFDKLSTLFEHISTPSLTLGSMVDTLITGSREEFERQFFVADFPSVGEKEQQIAKALYQQWYSMFPSFNELPDEEILKAANIIGFYANWKDSTRVKCLKERCAAYYRLLFLAEGKAVVDTATYKRALAMVQALKESPATSGYFADNQPDSPVQRYYQLKFKNTFEGVSYRSMADLIIVDYEDKKVMPFDLKTSGHPEWHFEDSFLQWSYMIQARLYWRNICATMDKDDYFKDFTLENYRFIVVNKDTLTPLVWEFPYTQFYGSLMDNNGSVYKDPFVIGKELQGYLYDKPQVPNGINVNGINTIGCLKPVLESLKPQEDKNTVATTGFWYKEDVMEVPVSYDFTKTDDD